MLGAKLARPNLGPDVLARPRLTQGLEEQAGTPVTLVVADAGFGKTVLLASFVHALNRPVIWYSLMPSDADPVVFGRHLLAGIRRDTPRFGRDFERALAESSPGGRTAETLGGVLANELAALKGPTRLLVLDDFQEVDGSRQIVKMVDALLQYLPPKVRLLIATRSEPSLSLQRMRSRGEVFELHSEHLRFTREELQQLFSEIYSKPLDEQDLDTLEQTTLGWPTAVHLVHESLRQSKTASLHEVLQQLKASNLQLHDFLSAEVYASLDDETRSLLECTAPLSRFDRDLAAAISGRRDIGAGLDALAHRGLLRSYGTGKTASFECHELIRRFIRQSVESRDGREGWLKLEVGVAEALQGRGLTERALRHYVLGEASGPAGAIVREIARSLLRQGRAGALRDYCEALPAVDVSADAALVVALADAQQALGKWDEAHARYDEALALAGKAGDAEAEGRALLGLARVHQLRGRHESVLELVERGLKVVDALEGATALELRARLLQREAGAHYYLGRYEDAVRVLDAVREMLPSTADPELLIPTVHNQAITYAAQGRHREASRAFRTALAQVRGAASPRAPLYMSNLALLLTYQGELSEARRVAEEGLEAARRFSNRTQETACLQVLAQILAEGGDLDGALSSIRMAEELNDELRMELLSADLLGLRGRIFCARGQYRRAVSFLAEAIESLSDRPDSPRLTEFRAILAWCELRAGRLRVATDLLKPLVERADKGGNDYERMQVRYWLAESLLGLGRKKQAEPHLSVALRLVRERGYDHFLRVQAREEHAPLMHALSRGVEVDACAAALVDRGGDVEETLLDLLPDVSADVGEAIVAVLGEVGGAVSRQRLDALGIRTPSLAPAIRTAVRHIDERASRVNVEKAAGPTPRLFLFGLPRIEFEGRPIPASAWRAQRAFHMLVFLALHPRGATRDELLENFWPGRQLAAGRRNFHPTLSYIRKVLPANNAQPLLREAESYRLNPDYPFTCDLWDFEASLETARRSEDAGQRRAALERAMSYVTGRLLEGFYGNWADDMSARTRDRVETALLDLGKLCKEAGDHQDALVHFRRATELDLYRESTRVSVIECLIRLGNRRAAVVEYDRLKGLLRAELSADPLPSTEEAVADLFGDASEGGKHTNGKLAKSVAGQRIEAPSQPSIKTPGR